MITGLILFFIFLCLSIGILKFILKFVVGTVVGFLVLGVGLAALIFVLVIGFNLIFIAPLLIIPGAVICKCVRG